MPAYADRDDSLASGIEIGQFKQSLEDMGDRGKVLVLLDSCHSGNLTDGTKDIEAVRDELVH